MKLPEYDDVLVRHTVGSVVAVDAETIRVRIWDTDVEIEQKLEQLGKWIDAYYLYSDEIDGDALVDGIYSGYAQALGDPYTEYYNEQETKELLETTSGKFFGVGATLTQNLTSKEIVIVSVYEDSPAADAGMSSSRQHLKSLNRRECRDW